ncbi:MAG: gliding motility-associated C-terminal domain-containing protein, partial [Cyclobacteriaceae bacterium]
HLLTIRAQDENFVWGQPENKVFFIGQSNTLSQNNITKIEYFIDTDPGRGSGIDLPITAATNFDFLENIPTATLSGGFHILTVRAQDQNGIWGLSENKVFFVSESNTLVQNDITKIEYFIDADPGTGLGVDVPLTAAPNLNFIENIPTAALSEGFHVLSVRAQDQNGKWSLFENKVFFVNQSSTLSQNDLTKIEYYVDTDPGIGAGVDVPISSATNLNFLHNIPTGVLSVGMHVLNIRAQDQYGEWSLSDSKPFFVDQTRQIINYEYAIDIDPGVAMATQVPIAPPQISIDEILNIDTNPLSVGGHTVYIRIEDSNFFWSKTSVVPFSVCTGANANFSANVVCLGSPTLFTDLSINVIAGDIYSWDFDGDLVEDDNTAGNTSFVYTTTGSHTATLTIDRGGCTSVFTQNVDVEIPAIASAGFDLSVCEGNVATLNGSIGGSASTATWSGGAGSFDNLNSLTPLYTPDPTEVGAGPIILTITTDDPSGICPAVSSTVRVTVLSQPTADAGSDFSICEGSVANLSGTIGGAASSSTWSTSGDGSFDNVISLNAIYTPGIVDITNGSVDLTLTTDDPDGPAQCASGVDPISLSINPVANVNAGNDIALCANDVATLTGTISPFASNPMWNTSGTGSFSSPASLNSTYTPSDADITSGSVLLTLSVDGAGACPQVSDQLLLTIALPITAGNPSIQSSIGQAVNVDVIGTSTVNVGDIITVSILQNPTKGSVAIQADNSIDYIAPNGTVGADTFDFQICNQCNLCSVGTVMVEIQNEPPILTPPSNTITAVAGQIVVIPFSTFIADPNNNIDYSSIRITSALSSGASVIFDSNYDITIDYSSTPFDGTDEITIEVCDLLRACAQITLHIEVDGEITTYNGISPNGDGLNDYFLIQNIQFLEPGNKVTIYNRWGDPVYEMEGYNPDVPEKRFEGKQNNGTELPNGVYFYKVEFLSSRKELLGYLTLKK